MSTESGTYTFENPVSTAEYREYNEIPSEPLTISGPLEELRNLEIGLFAAICKLSAEEYILLASSMMKWHDKVKEVIKDMEFERGRA